MAKEKIIGIDLGTSNSAASALQAGKPTIIPSAEGTTAYGKAFPSVVAFTKDTQLLVGEPARRQAISNPGRTITAAKRKMGTSFKYNINGKEYSPQQISAFILQKIKKDAEEFIGEPVSKAVITVPAYFNDDQRQATKDAGQIAGLEVVRLVNEPTAASMAFGLDKMDKEIKILVFDLGGGTLDVTLMDLSEGVFEVKATSGDTQLGGTDMDESIMKFIINDFRKKEGVDLSDDDTAMQRLREAAEKAKIELSTTLETEINLPYITATQDGPKHLQLTFNRAKLEELIRQLKAARAVSITKVDHEELMFRLSSAVMLVLNTGYEGFPHTVLEAMAAGTPVITTTVGGNPEIITDGHNGLLVPYNQAGELKAAIVRLLNDEALRQQLIGNAARTWQRFSVEAMLEHTVAMLRQHAP